MNLSGLKPKFIPGYRNNDAAYPTSFFLSAKNLKYNPGRA
jgi:hypothetical protein